MAAIKAINVKGTTYDVGYGGKLFYGTCSTAASEVEKEVLCSDFQIADLASGSAIIVSNTTKNTAAVASLTMNVNNTGAKPIKRLNNGSIANISAAEFADSTLLFIYDGTNWLLSGSNYNTVYTNMSATEAAAGTATTARSISAKVLNDLITDRITESSYMLSAGTPTSSTDFNTYITPGSYYCSKAATAKTFTHNPFSDAATTDMTSFRLYVIKSLGTYDQYIYQKLEFYNKNDEWVRYTIDKGTTWSAWFNRVQDNVAILDKTQTFTGVNTFNGGLISSNTTTLNGTLVGKSGTVSTGNYTTTVPTTAGTTGQIMFVLVD